MSLRRLLLIMVLTGLLSTALFSRSGVYAENSSLENPLVDDGTDEIGKWLRIIKSPDPSYVNRGETAQFTIVVLNTSPNFAMKDVSVIDQLTPACNREFPSLAPNGKANYICNHEDVQAAFKNEAIVTAKNATTGNSDSASDTAKVEVLELSAVIEPETNTIPSPGDDLQFTVTLTNLSSVGIRLDTLVSPELGDLDDPQNGNVEFNTCSGISGKQLPANGGSHKCTFTTNVIRPAGDYAFSINASGSVGNVATVSGSGTTVVKIFETIAASLAAEHEKYPSGSIIKLTATIRNLSETTSVNLLALEDTVLGDVQPHGNCSLPKTIGPGGAYACYYEQRITAAVDEQQSFILNVSAETDDTHPIPLTDQATATVMVIEPLVYLPVTLMIPRPDSCETALNIDTNISYQSYPDTVFAYYRFVLTEEENVTVKITNFVTDDGKGQLQLYRYTGDECDKNSVQLIRHDGTDNINRTLDPGNLQPDVYFVAVVNKGNLSTKEAYSLIVEAK